MTKRDSVRALQPPGDFCWTRRHRIPDGERKGWVVSSPTQGVRCLAVVLPGETAVTFLPTDPNTPEWLNGGVFWNWDGNEDAPTLEPSVDGSKHGGWHGFIRAGQLVGV